MTKPITLLLIAVIACGYLLGQSPSAQLFTFDTALDAANEWTEARPTRLLDGRYPTNLTVQTLPTGGPTTCTYKLQGTLSASPAAAVQASLALTHDATAPEDDSTVTIGTTVYTFKATLSTGPDVPYEVLIGASANAALDNLILAINGGAGEGTNYANGTVAHTLVTASARATATTTVTAIIGGPSGNSIATAASTSPDSHLDWAGAAVFLAGGSDSDWVDITEVLSCLTTSDERMHHVADKPVHLVRAYLVSIGGGSSPTVPLRLLATTR